jgi:hypothetical protein
MSITNGEWRKYPSFPSVPYRGFGEIPSGTAGCVRNLKGYDIRLDLLPTFIASDKSRIQTVTRNLKQAMGVGGIVSEFPKGCI